MEYRMRLEMDGLTFSARSAGKAEEVYSHFKWQAIGAVAYAREHALGNLLPLLRGAQALIAHEEDVLTALAEAGQVSESVKAFDGKGDVKVTIEPVEPIEEKEEPCF